MHEFLGGVKRGSCLLACKQALTVREDAQFTTVVKYGTMVDAWKSIAPVR